MDPKILYLIHNWNLRVNYLPKATLPSNIECNTVKVLARQRWRADKRNRKQHPKLLNNFVPGNCSMGRLCQTLFLTNACCREQRLEPGKAY